MRFLLTHKNMLVGGLVGKLDTMHISMHVHGVLQWNGVPPPPVFLGYCPEVALPHLHSDLDKMVIEAEWW